MKLSSRLVLRAGVAAVCCAFAAHAQANPTGPNVVSGQASFQTHANGKSLTVTNSPGAIIQWQGFSIARDELTRFLQQSPVSSVLNRVVGGNPSEILGRLSSNGRVYLINPNGIAFGAGAQVDVAGLVASSLNMSDADFISGRHRFGGSGAEGRVINQGSIVTPTGGNVYLVAPQVENAGVVRAPSGEIVLAAGRTVQLVDAEFPAIRVEVSAPKDQALSLGNLTGTGKVFAFLVKQSGVVSASAAEAGAGGKVVLKSAGQTLLAGGSRTESTGTTGGTVIAGGEQVKMASHASIDVSGAAGGGTALIGGGFQGKDPALDNAKVAIVEPGATIKANATQSGDGGKVVVFAEQLAHFAGAIEARGGPQGGDGGTVEVSGRATLSFMGAVDTRAPAGKDGSLLLDPTSITVVAGSTGLPANLADGSWLIAEDLGPQSLGATDLANLLNTTSVTLQASEKITIAADVVTAPAAPRTLTLEAAIISIEASITSNVAPISIVATASQSIDVAGGVALGTPASASSPGTVSLQAPAIAVGNTAVSSASAPKVIATQEPARQVSPGNLSQIPSMQRSTSPNPDVLRLRAEIEAEIARDRERIAQSMQQACAGPAAVKQGCTVNPPRRFAFAG